MTNKALILVHAYMNMRPSKELDDYANGFDEVIELYEDIPKSEMTFGHGFTGPQMVEGSRRLRSYQGNMRGLENLLPRMDSVTIAGSNVGECHREAYESIVKYALKNQKDLRINISADYSFCAVRKNTFQLHIADDIKAEVRAKDISDLPLRWFDDELHRVYDEILVSRKYKTGDGSWHPLPSQTLLEEDSITLKGLFQTLGEDLQDRFRNYLDPYLKPMLFSNGCSVINAYIDGQHFISENAQFFNLNPFRSRSIMVDICSNDGNLTERCELPQATYADIPRYRPEINLLPGNA